MFHEAKEFFSRTFSCDNQNQLLNGRFGSFHESEIALWRFKFMLTRKKFWSDDTKDQVREILHLLGNGVESEHKQGLRSMIDASKFLRTWPLHTNNKGQLTHFDGPQIRDFRVAMKAMAMNISSKVNKVSSHQVKALMKENSLLEAKIHCLKCIESILDIGKEEIELGSQLAQVDNIKDLFQTLVSNGAFGAAECVRKYDRRNIGATELGSCVICIPANVYPHLYCSWLDQTVIPSLIHNQGALDPIKEWCCKLADCFDQKNSFGIDESILLLQTVTKAIGRLNVDKYLSFSSHLSTGRFSRDSNAILPSCDMLEMKLFHANTLCEARKLGLPHDEINLKTFDEKGGIEFIAKSLLRISCDSESVEKFTSSTMKVDLINFCEKFGISFDMA